MTDVPLVVRKMALISTDLGEIARLGERPVEDYLRDVPAYLRHVQAHLDSVAPPP